MLTPFRIQMNRAGNGPHSSFRVVRRILIPFAFISLLAACELDMTVAVDTKTPPTFKLSGSGDLAFFTVKEIAPENQRLYPAQRDSNRDRVLWQIWPNNVPSTRVRRLPSITYGTPPAGFIQKIPEHGEPPPLVEGKVYEAGGPNSNANGGFVWFTIRNGEVSRVSEP